MEIRGKYDFRYRGRGMSRLDAFSDVVFGFALTLLVVSLEVPRTFEELMRAVHGFVPFAICFAALLLVWFEHYMYFLRYNMHRGSTILLNTVLLFVVLFYVYPLKFLFSLITGQLHGEGAAVAPANVPHLMMLYGAGYTAIYTIYFLMYWDAWRCRKDLELNEIEELETRANMADNLWMALVGVVAIVLAASVPPRLAGLTGFSYFLITVVRTVTGTRHGVQQRKLIERLERAEAKIEPPADAPPAEDASAEVKA